MRNYSLETCAHRNVKCAYLPYDMCELDCECVFEAPIEFARGAEVLAVFGDDVEVVSRDVDLCRDVLHA